MARRLSYHLLSATLEPVPARAVERFAWVVQGVVDGFADHGAYLQRVAGLGRRRPSSAVLARRIGELLALDANPIASLMRGAGDPRSLARRWNGFNELAPLGVQTLVAEREAEYDLSRSDPAESDQSELRNDITCSCVSQLLKGASHEPAFVATSMPLRESLQGLRGSLPELVEALYADPSRSLAACAALLGVSRRTLQRELAEAGVGFAKLRQAIRLTIAQRGLADSGESLTGLAQTAGFFDSAHLAHAWKRACGLSLSQYRALQSA